MSRKRWKSKFGIPCRTIMYTPRVQLCLYDYSSNSFHLKLISDSGYTVQKIFLTKENKSCRPKRDKCQLRSLLLHGKAILELWNNMLQD